jgi:catechol 2,3-dioxygenase-like lactoylglutathione lyase family enzyme
MKPRISMITLGVRDLQRSTKFYKDGLRFSCMEFPRMESLHAMRFLL